MLSRLLAEPPFRLVARELIKRFVSDCTMRARWDAAPRPPYLLGLVAAAKLAREQGVGRIIAIEFGVAAGTGLLVLEREAAHVSKETGLLIDVVGFDNGGGLPATSGDYRDHPDYWQTGDFPMDVDSLRSRLQESTRLILGNVRETVPSFVVAQAAPVGFVAFDLDLYTSTRDALQVFSHPRRRMLRQVPCYFDDFEYLIAHDAAGELRAIHEFNDAHRDRVRIDHWHGVKRDQVFPEREYLNRMFVAHDLEAISATTLNREQRHLGSSLN